MPLRICFYEDASFSQFSPLTCIRPVYILRSGILPLFEVADRYFPGAEISLVARDVVSPFLAEQCRDYPVNMIKRSDGADVLFLNGRIRDYGDLPELVKKARISTEFKRGDETVGVLFKIDTLSGIPTIITPDSYTRAYEQQKADFPDFETTATLHHYSWDIMADIEKAIAADFAYLKPKFKAPTNVTIHQGAYLMAKENIHFEDGVTVYPGAVVDASNGPIYIGANVRIESHAAIYGPCFIGANSVVLAGKITASSIGHTCRVGGEVEESVFHAYVNKYHAGFIGHSYVAPWVNFGAMTTNSDLKNNYSNIRCTVNGHSIDTGSMKVGSFIGDHSKFGIGTLLNTGIHIGVCCNIFGGGLTTDKELPPFQWGNTNRYHTFSLDKGLETARKAMERRNTQLSNHEAELLRLVAEGKLSPQGIVNW
ncbi:MAG TPA: putative sugar nucleotidyl transferase [Candidatus Acidoferrum sp.]|nr:putative sugar nucleotidyl transferase [Candidatus Acidoferrum sp.]